MNRTLAVVGALLRGFRGATGAARLALLAAVLLIIVLGAGSGQLTAQSPPRCNTTSANSPDSCNVLPLDAPAPEPNADPGNIPLVEMGRLPDAKLRYPYAAQLQLPDGATGDFSIIGKLPQGLTLDRDRLLTGTPQAPGNYSVGVIVPGSKDRDKVVARWRLAVLGPARVKPRPVPPAPRNPVKVASKSKEPAQSPPVRRSNPEKPGRIVVYRLTEKDLKVLDDEIKAGVAKQAEAVADLARIQAARAEARLGYQELAKAFRMNAQPPVQTDQAGKTGQGKAAPAQSPARATQQAGQVTAAAGAGSTQPSIPQAPPPLGTALKSLINTEYPTESLFRRAVVTQLKIAPVDLVNRITWQARKPYDYTAETTELKWNDVGGWKAVRPIPTWGYRTIYGFMPFWWGQSDPGPTIDFSLYDRIGIVGAQLSFDQQRSWLAGDGDFDWAAISSFARTAQSHGTQLDLVLEASNWDGLIDGLETDANGSNPISQIRISDKADLAANRAADLLETRLDDPGRYFRKALLPLWKVDSHVFSGLTVMFQPPPPGDPVADKFRIFMKQFIRTLMFRMKMSDRVLTLNIAVSSELLCNPSVSGGTGEACDPGPFSFESIQAWQETAMATGVPEVDSENPGVLDAAKKFAGHKIKPVIFNLIVFMEQPTREVRKRLRGAIDAIPNRDGFQGEQKVTLLRSIIPVMFGPGTEGAQIGEDSVENQLAYYDEVFGGVGVWPVAMESVKSGPEMRAKIFSEFFTAKKVPGRTIIADTSTRPYYMSTVLRLLLELLTIVVGGLIIYLTAWGEISDRTRDYVSRVTFVLAILTAGLFIVLLYTDPALVKLAQGNKPLIILGLVFIASIFVYIFKPKIMRP